MTTIDTNMSLVMIDPNEPLELYDGTIIKGRLEWFLYALCCLDYGNLPTPLSRIEEWANALITNELPNMEPQSRAEEFFKAILTGDTSNLPTPQSRSEVLLDKLARGENDFTNVEKIQSRYEFLLAYLIKNGGGIGNIDYILYKFQKEDETLYNTKERPVKSAILKGQTLVNLGLNNIISFIFSGEFLKKELIKPNTEYTLIYEIAEVSENVTTTNVPMFTETVLPFRKGIHKIKRTTVSNISDTVFKIWGNDTSERTITIKNLIVIEGDYTNVDIPYFEGMQSVKMPVLTTTGKNLFDITRTIYYDGNGIKGNTIPTSSYFHSILTGQDGGSAQRKDLSKLIKLSKGVYSFSGVANKGNLSLYLYDLNGNTLSQNITLGKSISVLQDSYADLLITTPSEFDITNIQLEQGSVATSYEPFKSNILTVNEDVTLRGIGNVQDTLDCLTGEVSTHFDSIDKFESIEIIKMSNYGTVSRYDLKVETIKPNGKIMCNKFSKGIISTNNLECINIHGSSNLIQIQVLTSRLATDTVDGFREFLINNNIEIIYETKTESIKTVDLTITDQGGATIPKLKTFDKITHVNVSATDILPGEVEMEVATTIGEDLSGTLYSTMEDIETKQEALKETNNAQTESIDSTMMTTTEIYESLL